MILIAFSSVTIIVTVAVWCKVHILVWVITPARVLVLRSGTSIFVLVLLFLVCKYLTDLNKNSQFVFLSLK